MKIAEDLYKDHRPLVPCDLCYNKSPVETVFPWFAREHDQQTVTEKGVGLSKLPSKNFVLDEKKYVDFAIERRLQTLTIFPKNYDKGNLVEQLYYRRLLAF